MTATWIAVLTFLAVLMATIAAAALLRDLKESDSTRIRKRISETISSPVPQSRLFRNLNAATYDAPGDSEEPTGWWRSLQLMVEQSGLSISVSRVILQSVTLGLLLSLPALLLTRIIWVPLILAVVGMVTPWLRVFYVRSTRLEQLMSQLPDAYSMMSRVMLAGQTATQAMQLVSSEFGEPISGEFAYCVEQQNLGLPADAALVQLAKRTGLVEIRMFVVASTVQREAGGNLATALENLSKMIRERSRIRGEVRSLTAEGRFQAAVLLFLPLMLYGLMYLINPEHMVILLDYPWLIAAGFGSECIGAIWIRRIVNFDF